MKHLKNIFIAALITLSPLIFLFAPIILNYNKSGSNTSLLGRNYSHLSRDQIISQINSDFVFPETIDLEYQQQIFPLKLASVSATLNPQKTASNILWEQ